MIESKIVISNRLRKEGRWGEASLFKDDKIKVLRDSGMHRPEAQTAAWEAMEKQYPPIEIPEADGSAVEFAPEAIALLPPGSLGDFIMDATWAYNSLELGDADIGSAPSAGAVGLLGWARGNRNDFYGKILPKALQLQEKQQGEDEAAAEMVRRNHEHIDELCGQTDLRDWLTGIRDVKNAESELKAAKGFDEKDDKGFAAYLRSLIEE